MTDSLTFNPFNGISPFRILGVRSQAGDNKPPVIPDEVIEPLYKAALDYVYVYSDDILRARSEIELIREAIESSGKYKITIGAHGQPTFMNTLKVRAQQALAEFDISKSPNTGVKWREPFFCFADLYEEEKYLFVACYIVVAFLTGMRNSEVTSVREGCLRRELSDDGVIDRYKITGTLFKQVREPEGVEETWVTIEPAAKAIEVLTLLTKRLRVMSQGKFTELFLRGERTKSIKVVQSDWTTELLRDFAEHVDVPMIDGKPWQLTTRQFRRTLARHIAKRPFGEVAGAIQFKQLFIATFEGYAGRDPLFRKELEEEQFLANLDLLQELRDDFRLGGVAGPKGSEILETFRGIAGDRRPDDEAYYLRHLAKILYVGMFNLCFYDPAHAMCQQRIPVEGRSAPIISHCQPELCPNSCITKRHHLFRWLRQLDEINRMLKRPKLPASQRLALEQEKHRLEKTLRPLIDV